MKAIVIREPGGPEVLELRDVPEPEVHPGHVRVRVRLAGVNRADLLQRIGVYPAPPGAPKDIPGLEYLGVVEALGVGVTRFALGERVYGLLPGGAYAELVVAHERELARVPASLSDEDGAAVPKAFVTAYDALVVRGRLAPGERVLVHAAGSGVGTQGSRSRRRSARSWSAPRARATSSRRCRPLGSTRRWSPRRGSSPTRCARRPEARASTWWSIWSAAGTCPRRCAPAHPGLASILVGLTRGRIGQRGSAPRPRRRLEIVGTDAAARPLEEKILAAQLLERNLGPLLAAGKLRPIVDTVLPIAEAGDAHRRVESDATFGKVLLRVG